MRQPNPKDKVVTIALVALAASVLAFLSIVRKAKAAVSAEADDWGIKYAELIGSGFCEAPNGSNIFWRVYKTFNDKYRFAYRMEGQDTVEEMMPQENYDLALDKGLEEIGCD